MKHAYLIIAHNELAVMERLISAIDDERNDIFVHWDAKMPSCPTLTARKAGLYLVDRRVDVRWGDYSVVEAEYALFEKASSTGTYSFYHLVSGVDMPLRSQDEIHAFFDANDGKEFIGFSHYAGLEDEIARKMRWHLFPGSFQREFSLSFSAVARSAFLKCQTLLGIRRRMPFEVRKGTQWISVTDDFVKYMISRKEDVRKAFTHTFCSDEMFAQTLCWDSPFRVRIFDAEDEGHGCVRAIGWENGQLRPWEMKDYDALMQSDAVFARKFTSEHIDVVDRILEYVTH